MEEQQQQHDGGFLADGAELGGGGVAPPEHLVNDLRPPPPPGRYRRARGSRARPATKASQTSSAAFVGRLAQALHRAHQSTVRPNAGRTGRRLPGTYVVAERAEEGVRGGDMTVTPKRCY